MISKYIEILQKIGMGFHIPEFYSKAIAETLAFISLIIICLLVFYLANWILKKTLYVLISKTETKVDDLLIKNNVLKRLCLLIPAYMIRGLVASTIPDFPQLYHIVILLTKMYEVFIYVRVFDGLITTAYDFYNTFEMSKSKPIKGLVQVIKIIAYVICVLFIIALLTDKKLSNIFIGLGTLSAVLMLVFKDPILGFVGSIQLSINDMVRIGDWIVMPQSNADGNVLEIGLTTVKVQNWDNTITTIPTYSLISDAFTNWRGMSESGGRRISRSVVIDIDTVKFCTPEMLERFKKFQLISRYVTDKELDIETYNKENNIDTTNLVNGRRQTNLGVFRAYLLEYLKSNPNLNHNMTLMVRQLAPTEFGIPLQIYVFSANKEWLAYENIQSDIFDHIYAVVSMFDLKIYQRPSSTTWFDIAGTFEGDIKKDVPITRPENLPR